MVQIIHEKIAVEELKKMAEKMFDDLVKAVVDIELYADEESMLARARVEPKKPLGYKYLS